MKVTIDLSKNEVEAITAYLKELNENKGNIIKKEISLEIKGMVSSCMQSGRLGDIYSELSQQ